MGDVAGLGRRARLDGGILGVVGVNVGSAVQAVDLLRGAHATGLSVLTTREIEVIADAPQIPAGIDGEAFRCPRRCNASFTPARSASGCPAPAGCPAAQAGDELAPAAAACAGLALMAAGVTPSEQPQFDRALDGLRA